MIELLKHVSGVVVECYQGPETLGVGFNNMWENELVFCL